MTIYTPNGSGNYNTAATWDTVAFAGSPNFNTTNVTTAGINSEVFTAPNTTNAITGVWLMCASPPAAGCDWTMQILESGVPVGSIATFAQADFPASNPYIPQWIYFRFPTPYTYTTTAAGTYRFVLKSTVANSGAVNVNAGSTGWLIMATDNRHAAPISTSQVWIGPHNGTTQIDVTVDGTSGLATGGAPQASMPVIRNITPRAIYIGGGAVESKAKLIWDTAADATLAFTGEIVVADGGELRMGTIASPYPAGKTAILSTPSTSTNANQIASYGNGIINMVGSDLTYDRTTYVSGLGTAASPLITAAPVDWSVGNKICVAASSNNGTNYNEGENKFIITKNSSTSYVVSNTSGGAENALTNTHTNAIIVNLTRNVQLKGTSGTTKCIAVSLDNATTANSNFKSANLNNMGTLNGTPSIGTKGQGGLSIPAGLAIPVDNCVFDEINNYGMLVFTSSALTRSKNIFANSGAFSSAGTASGLGVASTALNQTFVDHVFINNQRQGIEYRGINCTFTNTTIIGCNCAGVAAQGGFSPYNAGPFIMSNPQMHCNRIGGYALNSSVNSTITGGNLGTNGYNGADVVVAPGSANTNILFDAITAGSATLVSGHTSGAVGATEVLFNRLNGTTNNHMWFTEYGSARSTGAGLSDTVVRTPGTLNLRIAPENATNGFVWEYLVPAKPGRAVQSYLFIEKNAAFATDDVNVELFLPGSTVADAIASVSDVTGSYNVYAVAAVYAGTESLYARVRVTAKTVTAAAYIYIADIFNGTNEIINLNTWYRGKPSTIMFEQIGDADAVLSSIIEGTTTLKESMKLLNAFAAGDATGMSSSGIFKSLDGTKNRITGTITGDNRTITSRDVT
jgi:hypothetical protein